MKERKKNILENKEKTEILEYVYDILGFRDGYIYGQIIIEAEKTYLIQPYDINGNEENIFLDEEENLIPFYKNKVDAKKYDYVKGRLKVRKTKGERFLFMEDVEVLVDQNEFRKQLKKSLERKWNEEGFSVSLGDFARFDGEIAFSSWINDKVELVLEEKYEQFMQSKIDSKKKELKDIEESIKNLKEREKPLRELEKRVKTYEARNIISLKDEIFDPACEYAYQNFTVLVNDVWNYLYFKNNLFYDKSIIRMFMCSLRTSQLTLLWGRPGSGKTMLPIKVAEAIGAKLIRVQVQSNWTDNQDLLGFYNVVDKRYVATPFLDALIEASKHPKRLYLIVLDEMNLSCIEYYFSEMLNVFTWENGNEYSISLYSEKIRERFAKEYESAQDEERKVQLEKQLYELQEYTPEFNIPKNVRFIGTLNIDATTKTISPKVIDRSYFIELQSDSSEQLADKKTDIGQLKLDGKEVMVSADIFEIKELGHESDIPMAGVINSLKAAGISISKRTNMYIRQWYGYEDTPIKEDDIILGKILPPIDFVAEGGKDKLVSLVKILSGFEKSLEKLKRMEANERRIGRVMYLED